MIYFWLNWFCAFLSFISFLFSQNKKKEKKLAIKVKIIIIIITSVVWFISCVNNFSSWKLFRDSRKSNWFHFTLDISYLVYFTLNIYFVFWCFKNFVLYLYSLPDTLLHYILCMYRLSDMDLNYILHVYCASDVF